MPERCIPSKFGETNPRNPIIRKTTPRTLQIALAITNLLCFLVSAPTSDREESVVPGQIKRLPAHCPPSPLRPLLRQPSPLTTERNLLPHSSFECIAAFAPYLSLTRIASDRSPVINAITMPPAPKNRCGATSSQRAHEDEELNKNNCIFERDRRSNPQ